MHDDGQTDQKEQSGEDLKKYVKISSGIIVSVLSLTDLIGIVLLAICVVLDLNMLLGIPPLDEAEGLGFFESLLGPPVHLFLFVVLMLQFLSYNS